LTNKNKIFPETSSSFDFEIQRRRKSIGQYRGRKTKNTKIKSEGSSFIDGEKFIDIPKILIRMLTAEIMR
jgi:hypothetical protein